MIVNNPNPQRQMNVVEYDLYTKENPKRFIADQMGLLATKEWWDIIRK